MILKDKNNNLNALFKEFLTVVIIAKSSGKNIAYRKTSYRKTRHVLYGLMQG